MAPGLVGAKKAARGKTPTDVWWHTIVSPTGKEKTGYATQKPLGVLERIVRVHSNAGETVLDFFAGSGTTGEAAAKHGRQFILVDEECGRGGCYGETAEAVSLPERGCGSLRGVTALAEGLLFSEVADDGQLVPLSLAGLQEGRSARRRTCQYQ